MGRILLFCRVRTSVLRLLRRRYLALPLRLLPGRLELVDLLLGGPAAAEEEERFLGILGDVVYYPAVFADGRMTLDTEDGRKLVFSAPE